MDGLSHLDPAYIFQYASLVHRQVVTSTSVGYSGVLNREPETIRAKKTMHGISVAVWRRWVLTICHQDIRGCNSFQTLHLPLLG